MAVETLASFATSFIRTVLILDAIPCIDQRAEITLYSIALNAFTQREERNRIIARRFYCNFLRHSPSKLSQQLVSRVCLDQIAGRGLYGDTKPNEAGHGD